MILKIIKTLAGHKVLASVDADGFDVEDSILSAD